MIYLVQSLDSNRLSEAYGQLAKLLDSGFSDAADVVGWNAHDTVKIETTYNFHENEPVFFDD